MRKLLLATMILFAPVVNAQERWSTEFWNPKPLADDLILPMPCGGAMVFRPVPTPLGQGLLADRPAMLGQADAETNYSEFLRQSFIAGPFRGADAAAPPRYYIGKYEVTRDQYVAVTAEACPTPAAAGRLPQADIAWHEAIAFTMRYSAWLARNWAGRWSLLVATRASTGRKPRLRSRSASPLRSSGGNSTRRLDRI